MENKRRATRISATVEVLFRKSDSKFISSARSKDISEVGLFLPLPCYYAIDSLLEIEIRSDDFKIPLKALAKVVWISKSQNNRKYPFEAGLELLNLPLDKKGILSDYIKGSAKGSGEKDIRWVD